MKKILIISATILVLLSSCRVSDSGTPGDITHKGLNIYGVTTDNSISKYLLGLDNVLKAEEILTLPYEKRDSLEDFYFPSYRFRADNDSIYLKDFATIARVNDLPFRETGAIRDYFMSGFSMTVECVDSCTYILESYSVADLGPTTSLTVKVSANELLGKNTSNSIYSYQLSGAGLYSEYSSSDSQSYSYYDYETHYYVANYAYNLSYYISEDTPLLAYLTPNAYGMSYGTFRFYSGSIRMLVSGTSMGQEEEEVNATLIPDSSGLNYNVRVNILYKGESGDWTI